MFLKYHRHHSRPWLLLEMARCNAFLVGLYSYCTDRKLSKTEENMERRDFNHVAALPRVNDYRSTMPAALPCWSVSELRASPDLDKSA